MRPLPVLLTRPEADARRVAAQIRALGAAVVVSPLMRIGPTGGLPAMTGGVLLTSTNAVSMFVELHGPKGLPAWVVGPRTAEAARAAGFAVRGMAATVDALMKVVPLDAPPLVHLRGEMTRGDLAGRLRERGLSVGEAVIYRQIATPLTDAARILLSRAPTLVPLYSPRSAALLRDACPAEAVCNLRLLALSDAVAEACPVVPLGVSDTPDGAGMMRLIAEHLVPMDG